MFDLIVKGFENFCEDTLNNTSRAHILTRRVGPRATTDQEIFLKVNEQSTLYEIRHSMSFVITTTGIWNIPQEFVTNIGVQKGFQGSVLVARKEKYGSYRLV